MDAATILSRLRFAFTTSYHYLFPLYPGGDLEGQQVTGNQPIKLAAMEGLFHTEKGAGIVIIGQPDAANGRLDNPIIVPKVLSFLISSLQWQSPGIWYWRSLI